MATDRTPQSSSQSARALRSCVNVAKLRTASVSRSGGMGTNRRLHQCRFKLHRGAAPGTDHILVCLFLPLSPSCQLPAECPRCETKQTPNRDRRPRDERHHTSVRKSRTHASRSGLKSKAPMSRRAVAVIRPALFIISPPLPYHLFCNTTSFTL